MEGKTRRRRKSTKKKRKEVDNRITFDLFFNQKVSSGDINYWQYNEIQLFFKSKGLGNLESEDTYIKTLNLY